MTVQVSPSSIVSQAINALAGDRTTTRRCQQMLCRKGDCGLALKGQDHARLKTAAANYPQTANSDRNGVRF